MHTCRPIDVLALRTCDAVLSILCENGVLLVTPVSWKVQPTNPFPSLHRATSSCATGNGERLGRNVVCKSAEVLRNVPQVALVCLVVQQRKIMLMSTGRSVVSVSAVGNVGDRSTILLFNGAEVICGATAVCREVDKCGLAVDKAYG